MPDVKIYHLLESTVIEKIPQLAAKIYSQKKNILILCKSQEEMDSVDKKLWTFSQEIFLPHVTTSDDFQKESPILLSCKIENINNARALITTEDSLENFCKTLLSVNSSNSFADLECILWMTDTDEEGSLLQHAQDAIHSINKPGSKLSFYILQHNCWEAKILDSV